MIIKIDSTKDISILQKAATLIEQGNLVAFPTETVYGLGADALNEKAVKKIFETKGRPSDNPIIIHIADLESLKILAKNIPKEAYILADKFWPGPLTFILEKQNIVPDIITGGLDTVAIRMPNNKIALELIQLSGKFIAAPSANKSGRPSPTDAQSVFDDFGNEIEIIIDGGNCKHGIESTVIDLTTKPFTILRSGSITKEQIEKVLKEKINTANHTDAKAKSPGMKYKHYAPKAELILVTTASLSMIPSLTSATASPLSVIPAQAGIQYDKANYECNNSLISKVQSLIQNYKLQATNDKLPQIGILCCNENAKYYNNADLVIPVGSIKNLSEIASNIFKTLRQFDKAKIDIIISESFPTKGIGIAIMDKLSRAATKII